ncbi:phosphotransferase [Burkholderiaceae bacterium DAT-1]|nr:phosphotransferase [Burkholderiaceae bacterium DAT-1]
MERSTALTAWLDTQLPQRTALHALVEDGSPRRFYRATLADGSTRIVMDAPPATQPIAGFLDIARRLSGIVPVPEMLAVDVDQGFVLMSDLGDTDLMSATADGDEIKADPLYRAAWGALLSMQVHADTSGLPEYTADAMGTDLDRFTEWFVGTHLGKTLDEKQQQAWARTRALLLARAASQPKTLIHFDYHSRNLMVRGDQIGIVDFQDARVGPLTYDLASLLKDMYRAWPEAFRLDHGIRYWQAARKLNLPVAESFDDFYRDLEFMGVYRHLRSIGTFARLIHRDGKPRYLDDIPVALGYLRETCERYVELHPLYKLLNQLTGFTVQHGYTF